MLRLSYVMAKVQLASIPHYGHQLWGTFTTRYNSFKKQEDHEGLCRYADRLFQLMYCCFTFTVNSYGHVGVGGPRAIIVL